MTYSNFGSLINDIINRASVSVQGYCGSMFVGMQYNRQGNMISVNWANYNTSVTEVFNFPVISSDYFDAQINDGNEAYFTGYVNELVSNIHQFMIRVESQQRGVAPAN